jgi:hypothetical protein
MDSPGVIGTSLSISRFSFQPIKSEAMHEAFVTNLNEPDFKLDVVKCLSRSGGTSVKECVRWMIKVLLMNELQERFNRTGTNGKIAFNQKLEPLIKEAIHGIMETTDKDIECQIYLVLKDAKAHRILPQKPDIFFFIDILTSNFLSCRYILLIVVFEKVC